MNRLELFRWLRLAVPAAALAATVSVASAQRVTTYWGEGSIQVGRIMSATLENDDAQSYEGNFLRSSSAHLGIDTRFNDRLEVHAGMGVIERHLFSGRIGNNGGRNPMTVDPYIARADFMYTLRRAPGSVLELTGGYFPYNYNPDTKNLGLYLLRGPVYPGVLVSGFEARPVNPIANTLGLRLRHAVGGFEQDFILASETEYYPLFDISPAWVASYRFGRVLRVGAGVNFYHALPIDRKLTSPDTVTPNGSDEDPASRTRIYIDYSDTANGGAPDTTYLSFKGTKLMANASLDLKEVIGGSSWMGPEDFKLYGEVALIGLDRRKAYRELYGDYSERIPVMVGFNIPTPRWFDHLSVEAQWYKARFRDDLSRYQATNAAFPSPIPAANTSGVSTSRDDIKWSVHAARTFAGRVRVSGQVANDHTRPMGTLLSPASEWHTIFTTPTDWYWMTKVAFFF